MRALELATLTVEFSTIALVLAIVVYALGSFILMRPHTAARTLRISLRELAREVLLAVITQPFLLLFYLLGRRMDSFCLRSPRRKEKLVASVPVIFVHGYMQNRVGFLGLAWALARRNIGPLYGFNYPWFTPIASNAKRLERFVDRVCRETNSVEVDLVCHSMGGLVAMEMMRYEAWATTSREQRKLKVRRCLTLARPHAGVMWRGPMIGIGATSLRRGSKLLEAHAGFTMTVPTLSVFSTHDNVVHPKESAHLVRRGGRDIEIEGLGHFAILFSKDVADHVASFLVERKEGELPSRLITSGSDVPSPAVISEAIVDPDEQPHAGANDSSGSGVDRRTPERHASASEGREERERIEGRGGA